MKWCGWAVCAVVMALVVGGNGVTAGGKATELEGTWVIVTCEADGMPVKAAEGAKQVFKGNETTLFGKKSPAPVRFGWIPQKSPNRSTSSIRTEILWG
jgi:uncharacterized protein (TIGR03067 family)